MAAGDGHQPATTAEADDDDDRDQDREGNNNRTNGASFGGHLQGIYPILYHYLLLTTLLLETGN